MDVATQLAAVVPLISVDVAAEECSNGRREEDWFYPTKENSARAY